MGASMSIENNKTLIRQFQQSIEKKLQGQAISLGDFFCDDIVWHFPQSTAAVATSDIHRGKTAVLAIFDRDVSQFYVPNSIRFDYHYCTAEEDRVHLLFTMHAVTSTAKPYTNHYQSLFQLRDGKIAQVWEYFDTAYLFSLYS